jgi:hypothetical protein
MNEASVLASINVSQPQHTPAGYFLGRLYYSGFISDVLAFDESSGYPHNGGEHTLRLKLRPSDLESFLALARERFAGAHGLEEFIASVKDRASQKYPPLQKAA